MKIAIVGAKGAVGKQLQELMKGQNPLLFDMDNPPVFEGVDIALFCIGAESAKTLIAEARKHGTICIDASTAFREDPSVPLVIPEVNGEQLAAHRGIISSPNCTTSLMLMCLHPLHRKFQIKRIVASTYQAVSGAGNRGLVELEKQSKGEKPSGFFPHPCAFNVFPHESPKTPSGYVEEEEKMHIETQKILGDTSIGVTARCARVPVFRAHCISLNVEMKTPFDLEEIKEMLKSAPGVIYQEDVSALDATNHHEVFCGNLRRDKTQDNTLELWVTGDQLLKGAALNMFQIATALCSK